MPCGTAREAYGFELKPDGDAAAAIESLFVPSRDFKRRNLLYCDHVIHVLHLEALLFSRKKRDPDTAWLTHLVDTHVVGWIRIDVSWNRGDFLGSDGAPAPFFTKVKIRPEQLQVGDHIRIFAHPAYDNATIDGYWRLENALVVDLEPLRVQGHGINPLFPEHPQPRIRSMERQMLKLFNLSLERRRADVERLLASGSGADTIDFGRAGAQLAAVKPPGTSQYVGWAQKADRWLVWQYTGSVSPALLPFLGGFIADPEENDIAQDAARRAEAKRRHRIEYDPANGLGYFPLWEPYQHVDGTPVRDANGKIEVVHPVIVTSDMVAAWSWFFPLDPEDVDRTWAIRPTE